MDKNECIELSLCNYQEFDFRQNDYSKNELLDWLKINENYEHEGMKMYMEIYFEEENNTLYMVNYFGDYILIRTKNEKREVWNVRGVFNKNIAFDLLERWDKMNTFDEKLSIFRTLDLLISDKK